MHCTSMERWDKTGVYKRRLTCAGCPEYSEEALLAFESTKQVANVSVATKKEKGLPFSERPQPNIRRRQREDNALHPLQLLQKSPEVSLFNAHDVLRLDAKLTRNGALAEENAPRHERESTVSDLIQEENQPVVNRRVLG